MTRIMGAGTIPLMPQNTILLSSLISPSHSDASRLTTTVAGWVRVMGAGTLGAFRS